MQIIPAVDIRRGKCVQLVGGIPGTGKEYGDPVQAALSWEERGADYLHIVDLDAAMGEGDNLEKVAEILANLSIDVQVGGGIRTVDRAFELLSLGVDRIIVGTAAFTKPDILQDLIEKADSGCVMVALDVKGGKIAVEGWKKEKDLDPIDMAKNLEVRGVGGFLFTNVDVEGKMVGLDTETVKDLVKAVNVPIIAAGGVKSIKDVREAKDAGASGIVIGTALYEGEISFEEAMEVAKNEKRRN